MKPTKQIVFVPDEKCRIVDDANPRIEVGATILRGEELFTFTPKQLNQLMSDIIKDALNTAAEKATTKQDVAHFVEGSHLETTIDKKSIANTFGETFNKFKV